MPDRLTIADINLRNYAHNIAKIVELLPGNTRVMAVVKANAYGHGIEKIAEAAIKAGASYLGVVSLGELKRIRAAGIEAPVLILNYLDPASVAEAVALDGSITVMDAVTIASVAEAAATQAKHAQVHIKIDTGMHRAGCEPDALLDLARNVTNTPHIELEGICTHFAESEALDDTFTHQQLQIFEKCLELLGSEGMHPPLIHCANSAATIALPKTHFTMVRPGLVTYGLNPFPEEHQQHGFVRKHFKPVLSLKTQVAFLRSIEPGETVGYNRRWRATRPTQLALLPVGYGDGYRRAPHNAGKVLINGQYAPVVGSVAMDQTVVDITDVTGVVAVGDEVVLLGDQHSASITADDIAATYDTISHEVITSLSDRIARQYIDK